MKLVRGTRTRAGTKEYHYTLYYYDQAGNLIKALPPAAVKSCIPSPSYRDFNPAPMMRCRPASTSCWRKNEEQVMIGGFLCQERIRTFDLEPKI